MTHGNIFKNIENQLDMQIVVRSQDVCINANFLLHMRVAYNGSPPPIYSHLGVYMGHWNQSTIYLVDTYKIHNNRVKEKDDGY